MEFKSFIAEQKILDDRIVEGFASVTGVLDLGNDRIASRAFKKTLRERSEKVRHLWQHDFKQPPIAVILQLEEVGTDELPTGIKRKFPDATGALKVTRQYLETERGEEVFQGIRSGAIKEMSIGFDPIKVEFKEEQQDNGIKIPTRILREIALWDTSDVNWGMNPATVAQKVVIPFKSTGTVTGSWSRPGLGSFTSESWDNLPSGEKSRIANHFTWSTASPVSTFGDLKLPHHKASSKGIGPAVDSGVIAAMGALMGARGGVAIPGNERKGVYNHLAKHYREFDKEPPDFKVVQLVYYSQLINNAETLESLITPTYGQRKASRILQAVETIRTTIGSAEPLADEFDAQVLTDVVLRRLVIAEAELETLEWR